MRALTVLVLCLITYGVQGDMYLQNPRGCNDRLNEPGDRQNAQRLFDSENNARGGYCWGPPMSFVEGSILPIEWTAQHGCGGPHVTCTEIIQYMCQENSDANALNMIRDGTEVTTIPDNSQTYNDKTNGQYRYGMNENYQYYQDCKNRQRNMGLFLADQKPGGRAINTRQNPGGTRFGFECTEERDYYPYWHPSPWKDIAVLTDNLDNCAFYQSESQNVKAKNYCVGPASPVLGVPNNEAACNAVNGTWTSQPAFGIPAPECKLAAFSRDNHLGNTIGPAETANYTWILPTSKVEPCISKGGDDGSCNCVLRIRYNITTNESDGLKDKFIDYYSNGILKNNPTFNVEGGELTLALNTAQYGRTFQDRSYMFHIVPRPDGISSGTKIYNLNVRGKRGNIVQTFPATEYDFVPNRLHVQEGDIVHFQWTGCDNNQNNQGEGRDGTDRSNIVQIKDLDSNIPVVATNDTVEKPLFDSVYLRNRMALLGQTGCVPVSQLNNPQQDPANCAKLNAAATPYFNGGLVRMNQTGKFTYMSTRNNNFSNRTQKGQIVVDPADKKKLSAGAVAAIVLTTFAAIGAAAGGVFYYGKKNPDSKVGKVVAKVHMPHMFTRAASAAPPNAPRRAPLLNDHAN